MTQYNPTAFQMAHINMLKRLMSLHTTNTHLLCQLPTELKPTTHMLPQPGLSTSAMLPIFSVGSHYRPFGGSPIAQADPKPNQSYIGLIAMAILSTKERKLVLSDIYGWISENYEYFRTRGPGWKNSIRHNLSLNDCFVKAGRGENGKGHYWAIHPANIDDFVKSDFRRRRAQQKVKRHMSLHGDFSNEAISEGEPDDSLSPVSSSSGITSSIMSPVTQENTTPDTIRANITSASIQPKGNKKRSFDMESILEMDIKRKRMDALVINTSFHKVGP